MSKTTVTRLFGAAVAAVVAGLTIGIVAVVGALADGAVAIGGPQVVTVNGGPFAWAVAGLGIASLLVAAGTVAAIGSWLGALRNTWRLEDRAWFVVLAVLGLFSLGWVAMITYILAGPDSTAQGATRFGREAADEGR